jgi:hypothetical protein
VTLAPADGDPGVGGDEMEDVALVEKKGFFDKLFEFFKLG